MENNHLKCLALLVEALECCCRHEDQAKAGDEKAACVDCRKAIVHAIKKCVDGLEYCC